MLFPPHCAACQRYGAWLCDSCLRAIETIHPPVCPRCGQPLADGSLADLGGAGQAGAGCDRCHGSAAQPDRLLAYAYHAGPLRQAIHRFKYDDLTVMAGPLSHLMARGWAELAPADHRVDVIVPVPLHPSRQRQRGYNQSALLARGLGAHLQRPVVEDVLVRTRDTRPQVELDPSARRANVRDAFDCLSPRLAGARVLLVDDVCTTGSTLSAASVALRRGGAASVWAYVLARAKSPTQSRSGQTLDEESGPWS